MFTSKSKLTTNYRGKPMESLKRWIKRVWNILLWQEKLMLLCLVGVLLIATGCSAQPPVLTQVKPPASALSACPALAPPNENNSVERYLAFVIDQHYECVFKHDALREWFDEK